MTPTPLIDLPLPTLLTERLLLTVAPPNVAGRMVNFLNENAEHFSPWDPTPPDGFYTEEYWRRQLTRAFTEFRDGRALRLKLFYRDQPDGEIIGTCNFDQIFRGPFQACYLGYKIAAKYEGEGLMNEALQVAIRYVFDQLHLHRIMANYMPHNVRSGHLLNRLGFRVEGTAKDYLFINGAWRDHVLTSLSNPHFKEFRWY
ncbi:MAG: GNAT family N-acetyltransferase [Pseudomonadota bacterium]